jgi:hypothetical protein
MIEPNPETQYVFYSYEEAYVFYCALLEDKTLSEETISKIEGPKQSHGNTWVINKVKEDN